MRKMAIFLILGCFILSGLYFEPKALALSQVVTLQPGPGSNTGSDDGSANAGKDVGMYPGTPNTNYGSAQELWPWNSPCNIPGSLNPAYLQFSLTGMPTQDVVNARIEVYAYVFFNNNGWPWPAGPQTISLRRVTSSWNEMTVTFNSRPSNDSTVIDPQTVVLPGGVLLPNTEFQGWLSFDITDLYSGWADGSVPNYGIAFLLDTSICANGDYFYLYSSDNANPSLRPKLIVTAGQAASVTYPTSKIPSLLPLASTNITRANSLLEQTDSLLSDAKVKNLDTSTCEKLIDEAKADLAEAKLRKASPITANYFALRAAEKLQTAIDCLKALLG